MEPTSGWRHALSLPLRVSSFGSFDYLAKGPALREVGHIKSSWRDGRNTYPFNETMSFPFPENLRFCTCYRTQNHHEVLLGRTPSLRKACFFVYSFLSMLPLHLGLLPFLQRPPVCPARSLSATWLRSMLNENPNSKVYSFLLQTAAKMDGLLP